MPQYSWTRIWVAFLAACIATFQDGKSFAALLVVIVELDLNLIQAELMLFLFSLIAAVMAAAFGHLLDQHESEMDPKLVWLRRRGQAARAVDIEKISDVKTRQWRNMVKLFSRFDALISPTTAMMTPSIDAKDTDFDYLDSSDKLHSLDMTAIFNNMAACPAIAVSSGFTGTGLPTSAQIVGRRFDDPTILTIAGYIEKDKPWVRWSFNL